MDYSSPETISSATKITTVALLSALAIFHFSIAHADQVNNDTTCTSLPLLLVASLQNSELKNNCPRADAGVDQRFSLQQSVALDASASGDVDGQRLVYFWSVLKTPSGSGAKIANPHLPRTWFTADLAGHYEFAVTVTDPSGNRAIDTVRFSTDNVAPIANAGSDFTATLGDHLTLNASQSYDIDNDLLAYQWRVLQQPKNSHSALSQKHTANPSFYIDAEGDYLFELISNDGSQQSLPDTLRISTINSLPVAHSGTARTLSPGSTLLLDGTQSKDFDGDHLSYHWSILTAPDYSAVKFTQANQPNPSVIVDLPGLYVFQLMVDDGEFLSVPHTVLIEVKRAQLSAIDSNAYTQSTQLGGGDDGDGDGVINAADNCVLVANPAQRDTDNDGIGNFCDPDFNNDGIVNFADLSFWASQFLSNNADADLNGDGTVNFGDAPIFNSFFLEQPGPVGTIIWASLVDGDWTDRENWFPQIIPTEHSTAIIDVVGDVTVTLSDASASVFNIAQNEHLVLSRATFTATGAVGLGGTLTISQSTIHDTTFVPSSVGTGNMILNPGAHTWSNNALYVPALLKQGGVIHNSDGLVLDEILTINAPIGVTGIKFVNDQTLSGNGEIIFNSAGNFITNAQLFPHTGTTLTIGDGITVRGGIATIGSTTSRLILHGTIHAEGQLILILGQNMSGTGTWRATAGGEIRLGGSIDNNGDALQLDSANGTLNFISATTVSNTSIIGQLGSSVSFLPGTNVVFNNVALTADIDTSGGSLRINGNLELNGNISISEQLRFIGNGALSGSGTVYLDGGNLLAIGNSNEHFTIGENFTIRGWGYAGSSTMSVDFNGPIIADVPNSGLTIEGNPWSLGAPLSSINNGKIGLNGAHDSSGASLDLNALGDVRIYSRFEVSGTSINCTSGTHLEFRSGNSQIDSATLACDLVFANEAMPTLQTVTINGDATLLDGTNPELRAVTLNGDMSFSDGALAQINSDLTLNGTVFIEATTQPTGMELPLGQRIDGNATIILDGPFANPSYAQIHALGTLSVLRIGPQVTIRGGNGRVRNSNGKIFLEGTISADLNDISVSAAEVKNDGVLEAKNGHTLSIDNFNPATGHLHAGGNSTIDLTVSEAMSFNTANTFEIDIAGASFAGNINTNHTVNYGGALTINIVNGYVPDVLDSFSLFTHTGATGSFSSVVSNGLNSGLSFDVGVGATDVTATVVAE